MKLYGMVDPHVHLRDMAWAYKGTFESETAAACAAGYWAVLDMPNTPPYTTNEDALFLKRMFLKQRARCDWGIYLGASMKDGSIEEFYASAKGAKGVKLYCNTTTGDMAMFSQTHRERVFKAVRASPWLQPLVVHADGLETVNAVLSLVRKYQLVTHFAHVSDGVEADTLVRAKNSGLPISIGVCPHHLVFTQDDADDAMLAVMPSLKTSIDVRALWGFIEKGAVDVIESDHAPHTKGDKAASSPAYGLPGIQTALPLVLCHAHERGIPLERILPMFTTNVHRVWGITPPARTFAMLEPDYEWTFEKRHILSKCGWSPYVGMKMRGRITSNTIRGKLVFDGERLRHDPGLGKNVYEVYDGIYCE